MSEALHNLSLVDAAKMIADGHVSSVALTELALDRLTRLGPKFNCVITLDAERALDTAERQDAQRRKGRPLGPLHGVPLAHKDLFYRKGSRVTLGSPLNLNNIANSTATAIERLDASGAIDLATLHLSEFAYSPTGYNKHFGHCRNPWNMDHVPGGSSSGSGAAVASRLVYGSLGTDSGGSARHPAAMCGVTALKPTQTRVSRANVGPLSFSLDCVSPIARTARDCARLLSVIAGLDPLDPTAADRPVEPYEEQLTGDIRGTKVAIPESYYRELLSDDVGVLLEDAVSTLRSLGVSTQKTTPPDMSLTNSMAQVVMAVEAATVHQKTLAEHRDQYAEVVRSRIEPGLLIPATRYCEALSLRSRIAREYVTLTFGSNDIVMTPTIPIPVPTIVETTADDPTRIAKRLAALTHCTRGINYLGLPAITIPAGFTKNGLPCAFQLIGKPFAEANLLKAADAFQRLTDWHQRKPTAAQ